MKKNAMSYEEAVKLLEEKVALLEKGEMPLEETVKLYDEAMKLSGYCTALLNHAKLKITELSENGENDDAEYS